jgi:peptidoglycan hydrolase-like protein with peptidoglycan-binding domain
MQSTMKKLYRFLGISALALILSLSLVSQAKAITLDDLWKEITSLKSQITELKSQLSGSVISSTRLATTSVASSSDLQNAQISNAGPALGTYVYACTDGEINWTLDMGDNYRLGSHYSGNGVTCDLIVTRIDRAKIDLTLVRKTAPDIATQAKVGTDLVQQLAPSSQGPIGNYIMCTPGSNAGGSCYQWDGHCWRWDSGSIGSGTPSLVSGSFCGQLAPPIGSDLNASTLSKQDIQDNAILKDSVTAKLHPTEVSQLQSSLFSHPLKYQERGPEVKVLQDLLVKLNYLAAGKATGLYGDATKTAVLKFQKDRGIFGDGSLVGPTTTAAFGASRSDEYNTLDIKLTPCLSDGTKSITVISPNGNESFLASQTVVARWASCNIPVGERVNILLENSNSLAAITLVSNTANDGTESIVLPSVGSWSGLVLGKNFKIIVVPVANAFNAAQDKSDDTFSINKLTIELPKGIYAEGTVHFFGPDVNQANTQPGGNSSSGGSSTQTNSQGGSGPNLVYTWKSADGYLGRKKLCFLYNSPAPLASYYEPDIFGNCHFSLTPVYSNNVLIGSAGQSAKDFYTAIATTQGSNSLGFKPMPVVVNPPPFGVSASNFYSGNWQATPGNWNPTVDQHQIDNGTVNSGVRWGGFVFGQSGTINSVTVAGCLYTSIAPGFTTNGVDLDWHDTDKAVEGATYSGPCDQNPQGKTIMGVGTYPQALAPLLNGYIYFLKQI